MGHLLKQRHQIQRYVMVMSKHWQEESGLREMQDERLRQRPAIRRTWRNHPGRRDSAIQRMAHQFEALFRTLKRSQEPFLRPFHEKLHAERMASAIQQAKQWPEIKVDHAKQAIQKLGQKAAGPDGLSNDLLTSLSMGGHQGAHLWEIELTGLFPQQYKYICKKHM